MDAVTLYHLGGRIEKQESAKRDAKSADSHVWGVCASDSRRREPASGRPTT